MKSFKETLDEVVKVWQKENPCEDGHDHVTPFDRFYYSGYTLQPTAETQAQGGGEALEAELIALVAGPYHYHHKMDEHAEREGKAFDRCRELTIQNIRTWCATRRAMLAAQPPSAPVGVEDIEVLRRIRAALPDVGVNGWIVGVRTLDRVLAALAQQPAAVDGVMVERCTDAAIASSTQRYRGESARDSWRRLVRDVLTAALTAQPGGSDNDR